MMNAEFTFLDRSDAEKMLPALFDILHKNMSAIAPTGSSYEADFETWTTGITSALCDPARRIVLIYADGSLAGFFMYRLSGGTFAMEEIQLEPSRHGSGLFGQLYGWLTDHLYPPPECVVAYANKKNAKSQAILRRLGLTVTGENPNGSSLRFEGSFDVIAAKYGSK